MAIRRSSERAAETGEVRRRSGVDFPEWDGMWLDNDPGAIPPNAFRHLENVNFLGNELRPRWGQLAANSAAIYDATACIRAGVDYQVDPLRLYFVARGCPGISGTIGRTVLWYDPDFSSDMQRMLYYDQTTSNAVIGYYDGSIYVGVDSWLKRVHRVEPRVGVEPIQITGIHQDTNIVYLQGYVIKALREWEGLLYISAEDTTTPGASKIFAYDGVTIHEDKTGINPCTYIFPWRDKLAFGFAAGSNVVKLRSKGDPPGTYADVTPGAGTVSTVSMTELGGTLYIASGTDSVWSYNGTTLAVFRTVASATGMNSVEAFNGFLYYGYKSVSNTALVGRWNEAAVFEDSHKNLTTQFGTAVGPIDVLRTYRNNLMAAVTVNATSSLLLQSPGFNTSGTWTQIQSFSPLIYDMIAA